MPSNDEDHILIKIYVSLKDTLQLLNERSPRRLPKKLKGLKKNLFILSSLKDLIYQHLYIIFNKFLCVLLMFSNEGIC